MSTEIEWVREEFELRAMDRTPAEKSWRIPAHCDKGPLTVDLRIPEVRVTDSEGRHILVSPKQADLLGCKLSNISDWMQLGDADWVEPDD